MSNVETILESIEKLTLLEAAELVKAMEEKFGVSAAAPVAVAAAAPVAAAEGAAEEASEVTVILAETGANKIAVLKEVRAITGLGLKEAKELVDNAPKPIKENVKKFNEEYFPLKVAQALYAKKEKELLAKKKDELLHAELLFFFNFVIELIPIVVICAKVEITVSAVHSLE